MSETSPKKKQSEEKSGLAAEERRLDEVIAAVVHAADAKGWSWELSGKDTKSFRYATVEVSRRDVVANFEVTCDDSVKLRAYKTSFYDHGVADLYDAAWNEVRRLPWLEKKSTKGPQPEVADLSVQILDRLLRNFHRLARQLKHRHGDRPEFSILDEYDVQDLLHAVLRGFFEDIRAEEYAPSYGGGSSRMDFLLKKEATVVEVKMASLTLRDKNIGEQLLVDIARYQSHPDCKRLVCFVYDPGANLKNPAGLEVDLSRKHNNLDVKVIVVSPS
jgi:hypothetical protein